ncbi:MAG TPA: beta-ketoacyl synthase N-terminal-like domain-containing protein, partial [Opitutaceae bacterium]
GFRVEPGEIETALNRVACVAASAVVPETDAAGHVRLIAYWVARDATPAAVETIVAELKRSLPDYMVPARIERVRQLPLTPNGKIDRKCLQEAGVAGSLQRWGANTQPDRATAAEAGDGVLAALTELASTVLRVPIPASDADRPLGELGFDSIRYTALSTAVSRALGVTLEEAAFYELKTLRRVANHLAASGALSPRAVTPPATASQAGTERAGAMAIVGMEARLPGARDAMEFWRNLTQGRDGVGPMTAERRELTGDASEFEGGYLADVDKFDAPFFGISRREAMATDPRQRLFLEAAWRALEDAGIRPSSLAGSRTGVFVGIVGGSEYSGESEDAEVDSGAQRILGSATSLISARVSYLLDLRGPSHAIDTACSSSLVALHRAVSALRAGECEQAIVGGVNLVLDSTTTRAAAKTGMISPTARCRAFDVQADGYVRGEGVVALVLKPLSRAVADGDPIHAVILGTAENHGGRAAGLTAPNPEAQRDVIVAALERAGVGAE